VLPKKRLNIARMPPRCFRFAGDLAGWPGPEFAEADFGATTCPVKTQSEVTRASRINVTNCGLESTGGLGDSAEKESEGITTLTGGSSCGASGVLPDVRVITGAALGCSGMLRGLSASAALPDTGLPGAELFAGGFGASAAGGGSSAACTVGMTDVGRGKVSVIAGGSC
jgi:hypothetical protein